MSAREERFYRVVGRPGPGLARIVDTRTSRTGLWSKTLGRGRGQGHSRTGTCDQCGGPLEGGYYRLPRPDGRVAARLCTPCVEDVVADPWDPPNG